MSSLEENSEIEIANAMRRGEARAQRMLYDEYSGWLAAVCARYLGNSDALGDVLQNTFVSIFMSAHQFDWKGAGSLKAWLSKIAVRESLNWMKSRKHISINDEQELPDTDDEGTTEYADLNDISPDMIHDCLMRLPAIYRTVLLLNVFEQKNHSEISSMLGISESLSATRLHRAKAILSKLLMKENNDKQK